MDKITKKREIIFIVIGVLLLSVTTGIFIYSINFLLKNTMIALSQRMDSGQKITEFDLGGLKELNLINE